MQNREVAIGLDPPRVGCADDGLGGGPHDQRLAQRSRRGTQFAVWFRLQPMVCHHGALFGKAFDVFSLFLKIAQRDEERKVRVLDVRLP